MPLYIRPDTIPVLANYGTSLSDLPSSPIDAKNVADTWIAEFRTALVSGSPRAVLALFIADTPTWRDLFVLSWDIRTLIGSEAVHAFLSEHLAKGTFTSFVPASTPASAMPLGEAAGWLNVFASLETSDRTGTAVIHLVPTRIRGEEAIVWRAHGILMDLDGLKGHPWLEGEHRRQEPILGGWEEELAREGKFEDRDPTVIVVGGSQSGLIIAARLKVLGVPTLVLERTPRLGDEWRHRYDALTLHDPVYYDHFPYLKFPTTWPVWTPAKKLANFLESYASILEIPVWTSANVSKVYRPEAGGGWQVDVDVQGERKTLNTKHVIFALGISGAASIPEIPGMDDFSGETLHASAHKTADAFKGKKVAVVGSGTSAHDVSLNLVRHGVDVTMVQRGPTLVKSLSSWLDSLPYSESGPPAEIMDRIGASMGNPLALARGVGMTQAGKSADHELLEGLKARGFQLTDGPEGTGVWGLIYTRTGGFYFNTGASDRIIDGSIKLKPGAVERLDKDGLAFLDGTRLPADVVIWATGFTDPTQMIKRLVAPKDAEGLKTMLEVDEEGEFRGLWRHSGVDGLHIMGLNLGTARYWSKHLALRIKAVEVGLAPA